MAQIEKSYFFNSVFQNGKYEPSYSAVEFTRFMSLFFKNGVFAEPMDTLMVKAKGGMKVTLTKGCAFINGHGYELTEDKEFIIEPNSSAYDSKTAIVVQLDETRKQIKAIKKERIETENPVRSGNIYELVLAVIVVPSGASQITDAQIFDKRKYSKYCGFVTGTVEELKGDEFFRQYHNIFNNFMDEIKAIHQQSDPLGALATRVSQLENTVNDLRQQIENAPVIRSGTTPPSPSLGKEGDVYLQIKE